ncbi:hypothetical protein C2I18_11635 [Paenibacillus sp. PK3_47]|uniref:hypothetical protein n=1 Tax=Paenibacillus sp. PK3_47 TaxID=2072642 RepID=UPI00201DECE2|nr:hypothetical protein [Paenibacillus sp. PK3_47]UQZ34122.1 hypothetical protein C2I18_11635 [Paenibacillus sp. PK3_47]
MDILDSLLKTLPFFTQTLREKVNLLVYDRTKVLYFVQTRGFNLEQKVSDPLIPEFQNFGALTNGREPSLVHIDEKLYGFPMDTINIPITNDSNEVVAVLCATYDQSNQYQLNAVVDDNQHISNELIDMVQKLSVHSREATAGIEAALKDVQESIRKMEAEISQISASAAEQASLVEAFTRVIERLHVSSEKMMSVSGNLIEYSVE